MSKTAKDSRWYNFMILIIIQTSQVFQPSFSYLQKCCQSYSMCICRNRKGSKYSKISLHNNINPNTMQEENHSQPHQIPYKLAKVISNEVVNSTEKKRAKKEEVTLEVLETLLMGVLLRNGDTFQACLEYYLMFNEEEGITQSSLIQWICMPEVCNVVAMEIHQEYDNIIAIEPLQQELAVVAPSSPPASPLHVKMQARTLGEQSASTARSTKKEQKWQSIFEVINLCSEESSFESSDIQESNEEVMIYTHEQIAKELNFQLEGQNGGEVAQKEEMVAEPQVFEEEKPEQQCAAVQALRQVSAFELQEMLGQQSSLTSSARCGHFLFGDKIDYILDAYHCQGDLYFLVSWQPNKSITAKPSLLSSQTLKNHSPQQLISFYQHRLQPSK